MKSETTTVLIVDDIEENRRILATIIKKNTDYNIILANNGKKALEAIETKLPDIILLDLMMPDLSGIDVCRILQENPAFADIPVIMVTAKQEVSIIEEALEAGAVDYVKKPFSEIELLARLKSALRLKMYVDELKEALFKVKTLSGLLPICANCKKIRNDKGYWQQVESYMEKNSDLKFTHSICPDCVESLYPELHKKQIDEQDD